MKTLMTTILCGLLLVPSVALAAEHRVTHGATNPGKVTRTEISRVKGELGKKLSKQKAVRELTKNLSSEFKEYCTQRDVIPQGCTFVKVENVDLCRDEKGNPTNPPTAGEPTESTRQGRHWRCPASADVCGDCVYDCP